MCCCIWTLHLVAGSPRAAVPGSVSVDRWALWVQEDIDYAAVESVRLRQKAESLRDRLASSQAQRLRAKEGRDAADTQRAAAESRCATLESDAAALQARVSPLQVEQPRLT